LTVSQLEAFAREVVTLPDQKYPQLEGAWARDQIVSVNQPTAFRYDGAGFRLDGGEPYLRLHFVTIYVSDQERSLRFFVDQLGFSVVTDVRFASGNRWVEVGPPDGTAILALALPIPGMGDERYVGNCGPVTFLTEDVEAKYLEWSGRGVSFTVPPQTPSWGGTFCRFVDPDGNSFALAGFDHTTHELERRRREYGKKVEAERRSAQELDIAKQVQMRLFPQRQPDIAGLDYAGVCVQARSVGGDYYDFLDLGEGRLAFVLADIAGKGIAAALLMANLQANMRSQIVSAIDKPEQFLSSVNRLLFENTAISSYATLFFATYDNTTCRVTYANCGHQPGLILREDGTVEKLFSNGTVVGLFETWSCSMQATCLGPGDTLVLYSDGVTESPNATEEEFGEERLVDSLRRYKDMRAVAMAQSVVRDVALHSVGEQFDDLTLIVVKREK
jgi:serine phosphatase RsbU (regulator of sigma subunit)/predicted enzyme related to lactoylglutathione lyase